LKIVAFSGRRFSGKSTAAKILVDEFGYTDVKFADPLKNMLRAMYHTCGVDSDIIERKIEGDLKEVPCMWLLDKTPRYAMQTLGTEWRDMIGTDLWTGMFVDRIKSLRVRGHNIVCSDFRFPHEQAILEDLGATMIKIIRPGIQEDIEVSGHISETAVDEMSFDHEVINNGSVEDLKESLLKILS